MIYKLLSTLFNHTFSFNSTHIFKCRLVQKNVIVLFNFKRVDQGFYWLCLCLIVAVFWRQSFSMFFFLHINTVLPSFILCFMLSVIYFATVFEDNKVMDGGGIDIDLC
jgi:hypothetical protein